ncbi:MAG: DUF4337 domain-containing protein [Actinomycetota bacterium]
MTDDFGPEPHHLQEQVVDTIEEVKEELVTTQKEHRQERALLNQIGLSTGLLSGLAAIAAMQAGYLANEGMLAQLRSTDQWALYQAQSTKRHLNESTATLLSVLQKPVPTPINDEINKLKQEQQVSSTVARQLENEAHTDLRRHEAFARSVAALQIGISLGAIAALLRKRTLWYLGLGVGAVGVSLMVLGFLPASHEPSIVGVGTDAIEKSQ